MILNTPNSFFSFKRKVGLDFRQSRPTFHLLGPDVTTASTNFITGSEYTIAEDEGKAIWQLTMRFSCNDQTITAIRKFNFHKFG